MFDTQSLASHFPASDEVEFWEVDAGRMTVTVEYQQQPDPEGCIVVSSSEAPERLAELGLTVGAIDASIRAGDAERSRASGVYYPRNYPGIAMWAGTLAQLRRELVKLQQKWEIGRTGNYETVYSKERRIAFAVVGGDKYTGYNGSQHPKLTRKRGPKTTQRVDRNRRIEQLALDLHFALDQRGLPPDEDCQTWFVVVHPTDDEVRVEVSLPRAVDEGGLVSKWVERVLLTPVPIAGAVAPIDDEEDGDDDDGDLVTRP